MPRKKKQNRSEAASEIAPATERKRRLNLKDDRKLVNSLLREMINEVNKKERSVSDLIRLLQFRRELTKDAPVREIEVRWVETSPTENVSST